MKTIKKLLVVSMLASLSLLVPPASQAKPIPISPNDGCIDIAEAADGGAAQDIALVPLPDGGPITLKLTYEMYGVPDRLTVELTATGKSKRTYFNDVSLTDGKTESISIPAGKGRILTIIINQGGGLEGTAWNYSLSGGDVERIALAPASGKAHDSAEYLSQRLAGVASITMNSTIFQSSVTFEVPSMAKALRVHAPEGYAIFLSKGCPPDANPHLVDDGFASNNKAEPNWIIIPSPEPGKYGVTILHGISVFSNPKINVDVLFGGEWRRAQRPVAGSKDVERALVGVESTSTPNPQLGGPRWLLSHGNLSSPVGFRDLGNATSARFPTVPILYVNWSQGSQSRGANIVASQRWTEQNAKELAGLLGSMRATRFVGHSFGTWLGYQLSKAGGKFDYFCACDPANTAGGNFGEGAYAFRKGINFSSAANYAIAIDTSSLGDYPLATSAHDTLEVITTMDLFTAHSFSYKVLEDILSQNVVNNDVSGILNKLLPPISNALKPWKNDSRLLNPLRPKFEMTLSYIGIPSLGTYSNLLYIDRKTGRLVSF